MKDNLKNVSEIISDQFAKVGAIRPKKEQQENTVEFENFIMGMTNHYHEHEV